jgi:hypothetical protein
MYSIFYGQLSVYYLYTTTSMLKLPFMRIDRKNGLERNFVCVGFFYNNSCNI